MTRKNVIAAIVGCIIFLPDIIESSEVMNNTLKVNILYESCLGHKRFDLELKRKKNSECNEKSVLNALREKMRKIGRHCSDDPELELQVLLAMNSTLLAKEKINELCNEAKKSKTMYPFNSIFGSGEMFDQNFFNGDTFINYEKDKTNETFMNVKESINVVEEKTQRLGIEWPNHVTNFNQCEVPAAMCCWVKDTDEEELMWRKKNRDKKKPGNNANICYVDFQKSPVSDKELNGFSIFKEDEHPVRCHGFAWGTDEEDPNSIYKGNTLFKVVLDNLNEGYVKNIPGAPLCACLDQMPTVTKADCTRLKVKEKYVLSYEPQKSEFKINNRATSIIKKSCIDGRGYSIDLKSYIMRLAHKRNFGDQSNLEIVHKTLVGDGLCSEAIKSFLNEKGF